jgi:hypothetical protein
MSQKDNEETISSLTLLCNEIRQEFSMEYSFNDEEKKYIIDKKYLLLSLNRDKNKCYKIYFDEFTNNICDIIQEKIGKNIDIRIRKHIFIQLVSRGKPETSQTIEKAFQDYFEKYNVVLHEVEQKKIVCKMITCKGGIYLRETVELDSPIVKYSKIANKGILVYKTKFFCDYQVNLPVFVNNEKKIVVRIHVVNEEGDELGWTSGTNLKGELLCKDVPSHKTCSFKFIYADNHIPDEIYYDEFIENIASELGLNSLREDILQRGFIDLCHCAGIVNVKKIVKTYERIIEDEKETKQLAELQAQQEAEEDRKELIKSACSAALVSLAVGTMYKINKSRGGDVKTAISRKAVATGLRHLAQANTGARSMVVDEIASYLEKNEEGELEIFSTSGLLGQVGMSCLQKMGMGNIPGMDMNPETNQKEEQASEKNSESADVTQNPSEEQHMNEVDNLLDLFKQKENNTNSINMSIDEK